MVESDTRLDSATMQGSWIKSNTYFPVRPPFTGKFWFLRDVEAWARKNASGQFSCVMGYQRIHCYGHDDFWTAREMAKDDHCLVAVKVIPVAIQRLIDEVRQDNIPSSHGYNRGIVKHSRSLGYNRAITRHSRS